MAEYTSNDSPWFLPRDTQTREGDLILLLTADGKRYLMRLNPKRIQHTHQGMYQHVGLIGQSWGSTVKSQMGHEALILEPSLSDLMMQLRRGTQIIYPKDAAHVVHRLSLRSGSRVVEAGTGSGGLTVALAWAVAPLGRVYTYEARPENHKLARRNLERVALLPFVEMHLQSARDGFKETDVDAVVLDLREPWVLLPQVRTVLRPGGFFVGLLPTTNQVCKLLDGLERHGFTDVSVEEVLVRPYKPVPERFRPDDTMAAHTAFITFARCISSTLDPDQWLAKERRRYRARIQAQQVMAEHEEKRRQQLAEGGKKYPKMPLPS
ncbi:MAG: tRNA (adenine-N1)-methyltransferase [Chloroflexota bacterium]